MLRDYSTCLSPLIRNRYVSDSEHGSVMTAPELVKSLLIQNSNWVINNTRIQADKCPIFMQKSFFLNNCSITLKYSSFYGLAIQPSLQHSTAYILENLARVHFFLYFFQERYVSAEVPLLYFLVTPESLSLNRNKTAYIHNFILLNN